MAQTHYFTDNQSLPENRKEHPFFFMDRKYTFVTDDGVFSKSGVDFGSYVLLQAVAQENVHGNVLDVGCGYGTLSIVTKTLFPECNMMGVDVNSRALKLADINAERNGTKVNFTVSDVFQNVSGTFDYIITNPPIRAGKQVVFSIYEGAFEHLREGGTFLAVVRKQQGAESSKKKLEELFGSCEVPLKEKGYWILKCTKKDN